MLIYLCNALDEETKNMRSITTDSPAATKKVFGLCHALQVAGMSTTVLSMGRGRQNGSGDRFPKLSKKFRDVNVVYATFWHIPFFTHVATAFSLMFLLRSLLRQRESLLLVYNRSWHYVPTLCLAKLFGVRCFLDLEDGWVGVRRLNQQILAALFDWVCCEGSVLACEALADQVETENNLVCYGAVSGSGKISQQWGKGKIQVVFGGSMCEGTGAKLFIHAVELFRDKYSEFKSELNIIVVGFGAMAGDIEKFASHEACEMIEFRGSVSNREYQQLLDESHVGLCLKLASGPFHDSTFPSKVIELSSQGLLLVSTPVSDVPKLFSAGDAVLLSEDSPEALADALYWVITHRDKASKMASNGRDLILSRCSSESVGSELGHFLLAGKRQ